MIKMVSGEAVIPHWPHVEPILQRALDRFDYGSDADDVLGDIIKGWRDLWLIGDDSIAITQVNRLPKFAVLDISLLAGDRIDQWLSDLVIAFTNYAEAIGCKYIDGFGRKGWTKKLEAYGFKPYSYDVRLEINGR
jgi:hypothetical protein